MIRLFVVTGMLTLAVVGMVGVAPAAGAGHGEIGAIGDTGLEATIVAGFEPTEIDRAGSYHGSVVAASVQISRDRPDPDPIPFTIERVNGEDPDQVNEVPFHRGEAIVVELDGIDPGEERVMASLNGEDLGRVTADGDIYDADADLETGEYTLTLRHTDHGEHETATTEVEIVEVEADRDRPDPDPIPFTIERVNGEDPDQVNEVPFHRGEAIVVELDGIDPGEERVMASLNGEDLGRVTADGDIYDADADLETGEYTLTLRHTDHGEHETATTEVEVVEVETDRNRSDPAELTIERLNGEDSNQVNDVSFHRDDPITVELGGVDPSEERVVAWINDERLGPISDDGTIPTVDGEFDTGQHTLRITHREASTSTEIEIVEVEADRDERDDQLERATDDDRDSPPADEEFTDGVPAVGVPGTLAAVLAYVLGKRVSGARDDTGGRDE